MTLLTENFKRLFWAKVSSNRKPDQCWEWIGQKGRLGYGVIGAKTENGRRPLAAHRVSFEIHVGTISSGLCVLHHCDNPSCVNPAHLFLGTRDDNNKDAAQKCRVRFGERHHFTTISDETVLEIRQKVAAGVHYSKAAKVFNISLEQARRIANGKTRRHAGGPTVSTAIQVRTHCKRGHLLTNENVSLGQGYRTCKTCRREDTKKYRERQR